MNCKNHKYCKGKADGKDGLCSCCREAESTSQPYIDQHEENAKAWEHKQKSKAAK